MELPNPIHRTSQFRLLSAKDSPISEPPEITNWFPSYQYESLGLESDDFFEGPICEETDIEKDEAFIDDTEREKQESFRGLISENIDSLYSSSLPSEPVHVRNWFSNYAYESPDLDTSDGFRDSDYKESERENGFGIEERSRDHAVEDYGDLKRNGVGNDVESSDGFGKDSKSCVDDKQEKPPLNKANPQICEDDRILSDKSHACSRSTIERCSDHDLSRNHGIGTADFLREADVELLSVQKGFEKSARGIEDDDGGFSSVSFDASLTKKPARRCDDQENSGNEISNDGFVTTRRSGFRREREEENCLEMPKVRKESVIGRKALAERTNFQHPSSATEIIGKWKCPRERKPDLGPPLKQLRLERWVRRF